DPASALTLALPDEAADPIAALELMPATVTLALPPDLSDPALFRRVLAGTAQLIAAGHRVPWAPLDKAELRLDPETAPPSFETRKSGAPRPVLPLSAGTPVGRTTDIADNLALASFEGASGLREATPIAEWKLAIGRSTMPPDKAPSSLALSFITG